MQFEQMPAHLSKDGREQSVLLHSQNVAARSAERGEKIGLKQLASLIGLVHDAGKLNRDFAGYIFGTNAVSRGEIDHAFAGGKYLFALAAKTGSKIMMEVASVAARVIVSHHGLHDWVDEEGKDYLSRRLGKTERYDEMYANICKLLPESEALALLKEACGEYREAVDAIVRISAGKKKQYCFYTGLLERMLESILMDADRTDTADFMSGSATPRSKEPSEVWESMYRGMERMTVSFREKNDAVSVRRMLISDRCAAFAEHRVGICRLVVPTGGGKTLSSLRFAIRYSRRFSMEKILYVAPFTSILEQNSDVWRGVAGEENFLEHHCDFFQQLDSDEELREYELHAEKWDKPVIATTLVQFLNTLFSGKTTSVRRMQQLTRAVIIVDEVQSIPLKCVYLFNLAMNFLSAVCGCTIVLCSATQPALENTNYPLLLDKEDSMTGEYSADFTAFKRVELQNEVTPQGFSYEQAAAFCYKKYLGNRSLLVICNTKSSALQLYEELSRCNDAADAADKALLVHLSTAMCPQHRRETLKRVRELLREKKPLICVSTQLIEAGVDISFPCVVRSLAGMDSLTQAAGRCNRNAEFPLCPVYVIRLNEEKLERMSEMSCARDISTQLLLYPAFPDMLGTEAVFAYFGQYYREMKKELPYCVRDLEVPTNLVDMLSTNELRCASGCSVALQHRQAFRSAGRQFRVIEDNTEPIIIPYNVEAKELIAALNADVTPNELSVLLQKAQKYTVGIYSYAKKQLNGKGALYTVAKQQVTVLKEEFYSPETGVCSNGTEAINLII